MEETEQEKNNKNGKHEASENAVRENSFLTLRDGEFSLTTQHVASQCGEE